MWGLFFCTCIKRYVLYAMRTPLDRTLQKQRFMTDLVRYK